MLDAISESLKKKFDAKLVDELLAAYKEAKRNFYLGGLRLSAVEGGRFCEAAMRMLQQATTGTFTALGTMIDTDRLFQTLKEIPRADQPASVRLNIPRVIRVVYDIRNGRDAAHLADDIDPNLQDATLVISNIDWTLAEFVRLYHPGVDGNEAQVIVNGLVVRQVPAVQDFAGFLKVLNPKLKASQYVLLLLYERGDSGAALKELAEWVKPSMTANLKTTVRRLVHDNALVHQDGERLYLTKRGISEVERLKLHEVQ